MDRLIRDLEDIATLAGRPAASALDLALNLRQAYGGVFAMDLERYELAELAGARTETLRAIFDLQCVLREKATDWRAEGLFSGPAVAALRDLLRALRYAQDMVIEVVATHDGVRGAVKDRAFAGSSLQTMLHDSRAGQQIDFLSGDVLLVRGTAHNSAAIARIGDVDSQFSHLGIVAHDKKGSPCIVEALIEDGALVNSLEYALGHGNARAMLFRHRNPALARSAAEKIHDYISYSRGWTSRRILYDFSMELEGYSRLFCSKLVRQAYDLASGGAYLLPTYPTDLTRASPDFLSRIGVTAKATFAPGDMEIEPEFDLVAEWRNPRVTGRIRIQDMVLTKLFEWMEEEDWRFEEDWAIHLVSWLGRASSFLSDDAKSLIAGVVPKVPSNMSRRAIATIAMLHRTGEDLLEGLMAAEAENLRRTGCPLHPANVFRLIDRHRNAAAGKVGYLVSPTRRQPEASGVVPKFAGVQPSAAVTD